MPSTSANVAAMEMHSDKIPASWRKNSAPGARSQQCARNHRASHLPDFAGRARPRNSRRWVELIDQASQEAVKINQKLRQILRSQSSVL
jgi:hypothetical protein